MNAQLIPESDLHPLILGIEGMSCAGCVRSVEKSLSGVPGVEEASVNFANQTAAIVGQASVDALVKAVQKAGYTAYLYEGESLDDQEQQVFRVFRRSLFSSSIALIGGGLLMADMYLGWLPPMEHRVPWLIIGIFTAIVMALSGGHFFRGALNSLIHRSATMDTLIALGTGTAWLFSMIVIVSPALVPAESRHQFFEAALFILGFVNLGKALENNARSRASLAIQKLFDRTPKFARKIIGEREVKVPVVSIRHLDQIRIQPGDYLPIDGEILAGNGSVDESMITGESLTVMKQPGDFVKAGTVNLDGSFVVNATGIGAETTLAAMMRLVAEAQNSKPPIARIVDTISAVFVPTIIFIALMTSAGWYFFGPTPSLSYAVVAGMSVLIIACPCALGLAVPMSIMVGLGRAAGSGILIRNSEVLQSAAGLSVIVFDKTGTLTRGEPVVVSSSAIKDSDLKIASGLESLSSHPLARAIADYCNDRDLKPAVISDFRNYAGAGVTGRVGTRAVAMGSGEFLIQQGIKDLPSMDDEGSVVYLAVDQKVEGWFLLHDALRADAAETLDRLRKLGVELVMLTGDRKSIADKVAREMGIDAVYSGLLPEEKLKKIQLLQVEGQRVGMVGDGINDAAALAAADVGFAMGQGSDVAMESADVTLLGESLGGVERSIALSRLILRNIRQNLIAAFAYNLLLIPVAAGVLFPLTGTLINPAWAGLAMALSSVSVVSNAGRLRFS